MASAVVTSGVTKRYRRNWALRGCDLAIPAGKVTALMGPNGAGKTTLLNILTGMTAPTTGTVSILDGVVPGSQQGRDRVAYVAQDTPVYSELRVRDHLLVAADLNLRWDQDFASDRLDQLGIPMRQKAGKLSGGQRAQLALTLALARRPELLLLDEPMASLDPLARHDFLAGLLTAGYNEGITVLFSSHVLPEMERIASHLVVLARGKVQMAGESDELLAAHRILTGPVEQADALARELGAISVQRAARQAHLLVRRNDDPPAGFQSREVSMEELVLGYLREPRASYLPGPSSPTTAVTR
jgi:ABC-2 type transport system ATP-binding protein